MPDFIFEPRQGMWFQVRLGVSMQQWLELYTEPEPGRPNTWEDENKLFGMTEATLQLVMKQARKIANELRQEAEDCLALERLGATFKEASVMFARRRGHDSLTFISVLSDGPYNADEDVSFLYASASTLYGFAFEAASQLDADYDMPDVLLEIECCPGHWTPYPTLGHDTRCEGCGSIFTIDKAIQVTSNRDEYRSTT